MKGTCLRFYAYEFQKHHGILLHEWLMKFAMKYGIQGGSAFRAITGFGRDKNIHDEHFFELSSNVPIEVTFILEDQIAEKFLDALKKEELDLFYVKMPVEFGNLKESNS